MRSTILLILTLSIALIAGAKSANAQSYYGPTQFDHRQQEAVEAWELQGFYAGINGAEHDFWNHRRPDVNNREEYRDPDGVPLWAQREYREGFRRGYHFRARQIYYGERRRYED